MFGTYQPFEETNCRALSYGLWDEKSTKIQETYPIMSLTIVFLFLKSKASYLFLSQSPTTPIALYIRTHE
jgi:hypothetical protein